ncbi:MAG: helix-turn-helix transcriptional regulator [Bdellovibrionota bacterium]
MRKAKLEKLKQAGHRVTSTQEFLGLSDAETALVDLKIALTERLRTVRQEQGMSQVELARRLGSSQSRVAKMEAATNDVSLDLIVRALFTLGENPKRLGKAIAKAA